MTLSRNPWKLFLFLLAAGATLLHAQPSITSVAACPAGAFQSPQITGGITAGTPLTSLPFCIYGSFNPDLTSIVWLDDATGGSASYDVNTATISNTLIQIAVPQSLFTAVANPNQPDPVTITVTQNNIASPPASVYASYQVNPPLTAGGPSFIGMVGSALGVNLYSFGTGPYSNTLNTGSGAPGMGAFPTTGPTWSGVPTQAGMFNFQYTATDVWGNHLTASASFNILPPPLAFTTYVTLPGGMVGVAYSTTFGASGGSGGGYTFSLIKGSLPPGFTLTPAGLLSGTPNTYATYAFSLQVTDSANNTASRDFTLTVLPTKLTLTTGALANTIVNTPLNVQFAATGGYPPYTFGEIGALPPGTQFSSSGLLSGTPTKLGTSQFNVYVEDSTTASVTQSYSITIVVPPLVINTTSLASGMIGSPYSVTLSASGGTPPYSWSATGLPAGLALANTTGLLTGIPTQDGSFTVTVAVTDSTIGVAVLKATASFSLTIKPITLAINNTTLPNGTVGTAYTVILSSTGGDPPVSFNATGLPAGVTLSAAGALSGTPTAAGAYTITITATDSNGLAARMQYAVTIAPQLVVTTATINGVLGTSMTTTLGATGGMPPYIWLGANLPPGLSLASNGTLSGTPTVPGTSSFNATVVDSNSIFVTKAVSVTVGLPTGPGVTFSGIGSTVAPTSQPSLALALGSVYPADITVNLTMAVVTDSGLTDPMFQFSTGGLTYQTKVLTGSTGALNAPAVQMGTDAATITISAQLLAGGQDVTPSPAPKLTFRLNAAAPVITAISAARTSTGFTVTITGYATSRDVTTANFQFTASSGANLQTTQLSVPVSTIFGPWYASAASAPYGSQFTFTQPFNITGNNSAVLSVTVTLTNSVGTSPVSSANLQ